MQLKKSLALLVLAVNVASASVETFKLSSPGPYKFQMTSEKVDRGYHTQEIQTMCEEICRFGDPCQEGTRVTRSCTQTIQTPYANFLYDVEADVTIQGISYSPELGLEDEIKVELSAEKLTLSAPPSEKTILLANFSMTETPVRRRVKEIKYDVSLSTLPVKPIIESVEIKNAKFENDILTYETGPLSTFAISHIIYVDQKRFLRSDLHWSLELTESHRKTEVIEGGFRHSVNFAKILEKYKSGHKLEIFLLTGLKLSQSPNTKIVNGPSSGNYLDSKTLVIK